MKAPLPGGLLAGLSMLGATRPGWWWARKPKLIRNARKVLAEHGYPKASDGQVLAFLATLIENAMAAGRFDGLAATAVISVRHAYAVFGPQHDSTRTLTKMLAEIRITEGRVGDGIELLRSLAEELQQTLGTDHPHVESLWRDLVDVCERELGPEHPGTFEACQGLAGTLFEQRKDDEVEAIARRLVETCQRLRQDATHEYVDALKRLADVHARRREHDKAEPLYRRALAIARQVFGNEAVQTLTIQINLVYQRIAQEDLVEAEALCRQALDACERRFGAGNATTLICRAARAQLLRAGGRLREALPELIALRAAWEGALGPTHAYTLRSARELAEVLEALGRPDDAKPLLAQRVHALDITLGSEHPHTLIAAAHRDWKQGRYSVAEEAYVKAIGTARAAFGPKSGDAFDAIGALVELQLERGRFDEAGQRCAQELDLCLRTLGRDHPDTLRIIDLAVRVNRARGHLDEAERLRAEALDRQRQSFRALHPSTLSRALELAEIYSDQGRTGPEESLLREILRTSRESLGGEHAITLRCRLRLGHVYLTEGRHGAAQPLLQEVFAQLGRLQGPRHPTTLRAMERLASTLGRAGHRAAAERLLRRVHADTAAQLGPEHELTLQAALSLGERWLVDGRLDEACSLVNKAAATLRRTKGVDNPTCINALHLVAEGHRRQGRYQEAAVLWDELRPIAERALGASHLQTLTILQHSILALMALDRTEQALAELRAMAPRLRRFLDLQLQTSDSEARRLHYPSLLRNVLDVTLRVALANPDNPAASAFAADVVLQWKRVAGDRDEALARLARRSEEPRVRELAAAVMAARSDLSALVLNPRCTAARLATQQDRLERLEAELAAACGDHRQGAAAPEHLWRAVQSALPPGSALLELASFRPRPDTPEGHDELHWAGLLLPAGAGRAAPPRLWDLGAFRPVAAGSGRDGIEQLYGALFGKIDPEISTYRTLYLCAEGALQQFPFNILRVPDGRGTTCRWLERQALRVLRTGRDLLGPMVGADAGSSAGTGLLAFGDIDYDGFPPAAPERPAPAAGSPGEPLQSHRQRWRHETFMRGLRHARGAHPEPNPVGAQPPGAAAAVPFSRLPATRHEIEAIAAVFAARFDEPVQLVTGRDASETLLKRLRAAPRVLHLATHGFMLPKPFAAGGEQLDRSAALSGIAFSGANLGVSGRTGPDGEDGLLQALEVQDLQLDGTELVVLSACDSGRGKANETEGLFDLARAFHIAGADNVLVSLWALEDTMAAAFMCDFYARWLGGAGGPEPAEALRETQLAWSASADSRRRDWRRWAAFVLVERRGKSAWRETTRPFLGHAQRPQAQELAPSEERRPIPSTASEPENRPRWRCTQVLEPSLQLASPQAVAWSPDGSYLIVGTGHGLIQLVFPDGRVFRELRGHAGYVSALAVTNDGRLASGGEDKTIRIWDLVTAAELRRLEGHRGWVLALAIVGDALLASGSNDKTIRLWDIDEGLEVKRLEGHREKIRALIAIGEGRLASSEYASFQGQDAAIRLWDLDTGRELQRLEGHKWTVEDFAMTGDGCLASASADKTIRLWDLGTGREVRRIEGHTKPVHALVVTGDGRMVSSSFDNSIRVWDLAAGTEITQLKGQSGWVRRLALSGDGRLASVSTDDSIHLWDLASYAERHRMQGRAAEVRTLAATGDGRLVSGAASGIIRVWDVDTGLIIHQLQGHRSPVSALAVYSDRWLASGAPDETIRFWDLDMGTELDRLMSPPNEWLFRLDDPAPGYEDARFKTPACAVKALAFSADGLLASASNTNASGSGIPRPPRSFVGSERARVKPRHSCRQAMAAWPPGWATARSGSGSCHGRRTATVGRASRPGLGAGPDPAWEAGLRSGLRDKTIRLWDLDTGTELRRLEGPASTVACPRRALRRPAGVCALRRDDRHLGAVRGGGTGAVGGTLGLGHSTGACPGKLLISGSIDGTIRVWNKPSAREAAPAAALHAHLNAA
jgi:WD40 repeat protein/tetratricopeptide (TPR) repeat protein